MSDILVKYNSTRLFPTPLVNHNYEMIDLNNRRWGNVETIELDGVLTGISSSGDYQNLTQIFANNFGNLTVADESSIFYNWNNIVVDDITFDSSKWFVNGIVGYKIKLKSFNFPSGVIDASNLYEFSQNEDGTVNVNHKISAKGVKTINGAFDNAIALVNLFTGKNPYTNCIPAFIPNGNGVLFSITENIDRLAQNYSVTEQYRYTTGSVNDYLTIESLSVQESSTQEYVNMDYAIKYLASPVSGSLNSIQTSIGNTDFPSRIQSTYGIDKTQLYKNSFSLNQDTGAKTVDLKFNFISGLGNDASGYFDFVVSVDENLVNRAQTWKIEGQFVSKGPASFRRQALLNFKNDLLSSGSFESYLYNGIIFSPLYNYDVLIGINQRPTTFTWDENTGLAVLKLAATFDDVENTYNLISPKFEIQFEPSKWSYDLLPSANIEGHYVIQDPQMRTAAKIQANFSAGLSGLIQPTLDLLGVSFSFASGAYAPNSYLVKETISSGINEVSRQYEFVIPDIPNSTNTSNYKVFGSFASDYVRPKGYSFGY